MEASTLQIQTVLYGMDHPSLFRALDSLANAVRVDRERSGVFKSIVMVHGDASPMPTFTEAQVREITDRYARWFSYRYQFFDENTGTSKGHNRMFETCDADYLVVQNPDIQYGPLFFERMLQPFDRTDVEVGLVEARQVPIEHSKAYDPITKVTPWSTGACFMVPSAVYREVGGFDAASFFMYCDDVDLSWRIRLTGRCLIYQPLAPVFHPKHLDKLGKWVSTPAEAYYSLEALLLMSYKWSHDQHLERLLRQFREGRDENQRRAAEAFEQRRLEGNLPERLDPTHRVADINEVGYAQYRYTL